MNYRTQSVNTNDNFEDDCERLQDFKTLLAKIREGEIFYKTVNSNQNFKKNFSDSLNYKSNIEVGEHPLRVNPSSVTADTRGMTLQQLSLL
jgi:hypothetical protein